MGLEILWTPELEAVPETDEGHPVLDTGMLADKIRDHDTPLGIGLQIGPVAISQDHQVLVFRRERVQLLHLLLEPIHQLGPTHIHDRLVQIAHGEQLADPARGDHLPEGGGDRNSALGIHVVDVVREKPVHQSGKAPARPVSTTFPLPSRRMARLLRSQIGSIRAQDARTDGTRS